MGNNEAVNIGFDNSYRINSITSGNTLQLSYLRDNEGHITSITNILESQKSQALSYDNLYRLTNAAGIYGNITFGYDNNGNRLSMLEGGNSTSYTY
jgi:hypothetical protein